MNTKNDYLEDYKNLVMLSCSGKTIPRYCKIVGDYLDYVGDPNTATYSQVLTYINTFNSTSSKKQAQGALMHFYKGVVPRKDLIVRLPKIKEEQKLPEILTQIEINKLLSNIKNLKHLAIVTLLYHCGLRINELLHIQLKDLSSSNCTLHIKFSKGAKQRIVPFSEEVKELLFAYCRKYKPNNYLFYGQGKNTYSAGSVRKFLKAEVKKIGVLKNITPHSLRHSRATHLLMNDVDIKMVKDLLGHTKISTTERYLRLTVKDLQYHIQQADLKIKQATTAA